MRLPRLRVLRPIFVTLALLSCTENGPVGPQLNTSARLNASGSSQSVVISQVYGGGGNATSFYKNDFIELFNNGSDAVNLTGWSVQYVSAAGPGSGTNPWQKTDLSGTLQPGKYLLIQEAAGTTVGGGTAALPSPDIIAAPAINLSGTDGKVALVKSSTLLTCGAAGNSCAGNGAIADFVGYGTATYYEGLGTTGVSAAQALTNSTSDSRNGSSCTDTDRNSADFTRGAVAPRSGALAAAPCGVPPATVDHVTISPTSSSIGYHGTQNYEAHAFDAANHDITATNPIGWTSSSTTLATVVSTGTNPATATATSVGYGDVTITASSGGKTAGASLHINAPPLPPSVHFSELHYDNSGTDVNEKIEIEGPANQDLTGWQVVLYGGDAVPDFSAYSTTTLGVTLPTSCGSTGVIVVSYDLNGIKNAKFNGTGNPAGMALVDNTGHVVEFLSYEGTFTASDGPAAGMTSQDIGVAEEPAPAPGNSLHRAADGIWSAPSAADFGVCNGTGGPPPTSTNTMTFSGRLAGDPALPVGFEDQLFATEKDGATGATISTTITWSAETPAIATIDATGIMHAVSQGTATFRATATDGTTATYSLAMVTNTFSTTADWSGNLEFGIPTGHVQAGDRLITHNQFTSSFNTVRNIPNWVSAKLDASHYGTGADRCDCFTYDPLVADSGGTPYTTDVYTGEGSVWNRGHLLRSADVESSAGDNSIAYLFTNIAPQSAQMNQVPWAQEENFLGDLAHTGGKDVYQIIGVSGVSATEARLKKANVTIPAYFWKVAVIVPHGVKLADIHSYTDLQVIAVVMPNVASLNSDWTTYKVTTDSVEALSGYDLLNALPDDIELLVESNDRPPTAVMTGPDAGTEGSSLSFDGSTSSDPDAGDVLTYSWNFGDNKTATGVNPTHVFTDNGQYIVTLTVTDHIGAKSSTTKAVTISNVAPSGSFASPAPVNEGESFTLSIANATDPSSDDIAAGLSYRFDCGTGFGGWTSSSSITCFAADNPGSAVAAEVKDKDGGVAHYSGAIVVNNVTPTALFSNNGPIDEGTGFTLRLDGAMDPGPSDVAAGLQYRFDCGSGPGAWQYSATAFCPAADNGTFTVSGEVRDKDGAENIYSATVVVNNVAPTADFSNNGPVDEGHSYTLTLANGSDVSSVDVSAGLQYRFDCGTGSGFGSWGSSSSIACPPTDNGVFAVAGEIRDKDLAVSSYTGSVTVNNVAPTAVFLYTGAVNEGTPFTLKLENGTDSPADVAAGLQYRFDCGTGFGDWGSATSISCPTNDNGTPNVSGEIRDHDGAVSTYNGTVAVANVAPSGSFSTTAPVNEGSSYTLSISGGSDVSSADVAAGLEYRFDCGTGFGAWGSATSAVCAAPDNPGSQTKGEVRDKDGAVSSYATFSAVNNLNPSVVVSAASPITSGDTYSISAGFADAGQADGPWTYVINWGDGNTAGSTNAQGAITGSHQYLIAGTYTVTLTVKDKDGGIGSASTTLQVGRVAGSMSVNPNQINISNNGNGEVITTVYGNGAFNAGAINISSVRIGHTAPNTTGNGSPMVSIADVNHDGILDLVAHFQRSTLVANGDIGGSSTQLSLDATLNDGRQIRATGGVSVR